MGYIGFICKIHIYVYSVSVFLMLHFFYWFAGLPFLFCMLLQKQKLACRWRSAIAVICGVSAKLALLLYRMWGVCC
jgi:hypothetical protein